MELNDFLILAKQHAFNSLEGLRNNYKDLDDGFRECVFEQDGYLYRDRYFGVSPFVGRETVFYEGKAVWVMNYYGRMLDEKTDPRTVIDFLGHVLVEGSNRLPCRGPKFFASNNFVYINHVEGDLREFQGKESILLNGENVYQLYYHGGTVA
jgi:hypothetical protein